MLFNKHEILLITASIINISISIILFLIGIICRNINSCILTNYFNLFLIGLESSWSIESLLIMIFTWIYRNDLQNHIYKKIIIGVIYVDLL